MGLTLLNTFDGERILIDDKEGMIGIIDEFALSYLNPNPLTVNPVRGKDGKMTKPMENEDVKKMIALHEMRKEQIGKEREDELRKAGLLK